MTPAAEIRMAKKKSKPKGRPKGEGRITTRLAIVAKPEWLAWIDEIRAEIPTHDGIPPDRAGAIDYIARFYAEKMKKRLPPPRH